MRILVVDDHILFREGLVSLLASYPDLSIVGEAGSVHEAVERTVELNPDVVLLDINLPDGSGLDALNTILIRRPETKVVILTMHESDDLLFEAIRNGAIGYLLKDMPASKLILSIQALKRGEAALSRIMTGRIVEELQRVGKYQPSDDNNLNILTLRELEVLKLLGENASNREIANRLFITENTVKVHVHNILGKLNLRNRREAGRFARRNKLSIPPIDPQQQNK